MGARLQGQCQEHLLGRQDRVAAFHSARKGWLHDQHLLHRRHSSASRSGLVQCFQGRRHKCETVSPPLRSFELLKQQFQATKGLAAEYGPHNIRVNSVAPLLSGTGLFSMFTGMEDTPENRAKFIGNVPLGRLTEADDIANMCLYLASDEGSFINGTEMVVDGGKCI